MVESEERRIIECVETGRYEDALSVTLESPRSEINRAHMKLLSRFRDRPLTRELINEAKSRLTGETDLEKGRRLTRIGRKTEALNYLTAALANGGAADDYILAGQAYEQTWRTETAVSYFQRAVDLRGDATDHLWLGTALERLDRNAEALEAFISAVQLRGSADDHLSIGNLLIKIKMYPEARAHIERAIAMGEQETGRDLLSSLKREQFRRRIAGASEAASRVVAMVKKRPIIWVAVGLVMSGALLALIQALSQN